MAQGDLDDGTRSAPGRWLPFALAGVGLTVGLLVVFLQPVSWPPANFLVGGAFLAVAVGSLAHLIALHSGPGEGGPDV